MQLSCPAGEMSLLTPGICVILNKLDCMMRNNNVHRISAATLTTG